MAYQDGLEKAKKYAELAGLKIIKAIKISENKSSSYYDRENGGLYICGMFTDSSTQLPIGKVEKTMELYIDFIAE